MSNRKDVIIGIDVGGTHVRMGMVDASNRLISSDSRPSAMINDPKEGPTLLLELLADQVTRWCGDEYRAAAFALGFPSTISRDRRKVLQTPNLDGFDDAPIVDLVEARFGVPALLEKDVIFLLQHDIEDLGLDRRGTIIGVYFGTGIGNAIFMNGSFYAGKNGVAGELGHIPMNGAIRQCGCRNIGCIETEASGKRLAELAGERFPGEHVAHVFAHHEGEDVIQSFLEWLSIPLAVEINILDPDEVVIGGGITRMEAFPRAAFTERILAHVRKPMPAAGLSIRFSSGDEYAGIFGGAQLARHMLRDGSRP
jgi:allose kinase